MMPSGPCSNTQECTKGAKDRGLQCQGPLGAHDLNSIILPTGRVIIYMIFLIKRGKINRRQAHASETGMDLQGAFSLSFLLSSDLRKIGCGYLLFYKDHCCFTVTAFVFISAKEPRWPKWFGDRAKKGREAICHLFVLVLFAS